MKYEIKGGNLPVVICTLQPGETMVTESGAMSWMSPNMKMETGAKGGLGGAFGRMFSGESIFQNRYTAQKDEGLIAFASSFPGEIRAVDIAPGRSIVVQKRGFLACTEGVNLSVFFQKKFGTGLFGGRGIDIGDHHSPSALGEGGGDGPADPRSGAGDDGGLVVGGLVEGGHDRAFRAMRWDIGVSTSPSSRHWV